MRSLALGLALVVGCGDDGDSNGIPDAPTGGTVPFTNAMLFRVDSNGTNLASGAGVVARGVWSTVTGVQNIPGNFIVRFFLASTSDSTADQLFPLAGALSAPLALGANTFHLFADGDDMAGGTFGFGLNLWLDGAPTGSPSISAFLGTEGAGTAFAANTSADCTAGFDAHCIPAAGTLSATAAGHTVRMTAFSITTVGGAPAGACVDKVGADNTMPVVTNMPSGICDTVGTFTLTVE